MQIENVLIGFRCAQAPLGFLSKTLLKLHVLTDLPSSPFQVALIEAARDALGADAPAAQSFPEASDEVAAAASASEPATSSQTAAYNFARSPDDLVSDLSASPLLPLCSPSVPLFLPSHATNTQEPQGIQRAQPWYYEVVYTAKVLAKYKLKSHRISECMASQAAPTKAAAHILQFPQCYCKSPIPLYSLETCTCSNTR